MPKHILMLLSNEYRPDPRVEKEALTLLAEGYDVTIVCWDREHRYESIVKEKGINILRVRTKVVKNKNDMPLQLTQFIFQCLKKTRSLRVDVVHCHDLDTLFAGLVISKMKSVPLIYDAHEHYSWMVQGDVPEFLIPLIDRYESIMVKNVNRVIAANSKISENLERYSKKKPLVIMNCIDRDPELKPSPNWNGPIRIFYGGSIEPLRYILELVRKVKDHGPSWQLVIAGSGSLENELREEIAKVDNIVYLGRISKKELMAEMACSHVVIGLLDPNNRNNVIGTPNRLFEAMSIGIPILASKGTYAGDIVANEGCGLVLDFNVDDMDAVMKTLSDRVEWEEMSKNGMKAYDKKYNWGIMAKRLSSLYRDELSL